MKSEQKSIFYIGTFSGYIYVAELDKTQEKLSIINRIQHNNRPAFICLSRDKKFLYVSNEHMDGIGGVSAYDVSDEYAPKHINTITFTTEGPSHATLTEDQRYLLSAGYFDGRVIVNPVNADGSLAQSSCIIQHNGSGPFRGGICVSSQAQARAHFICQVPGTGYILNTDLGTDEVYVYTMDAGKLIEHSTFKAAPGAGPRHLDIHPSGKTVYLICELGNLMYVLDFDREKGILKEAQNVSTLPVGCKVRSWASAVHLSEDGRFLYGSNRGYDNIAVFSVDQLDHGIKPVQYFRDNVYNPRDFRMDPTGRYMIIGNMDTDTISLNRVCGETGRLEYVSRLENIEAPSCILFY